MENVKSSADTGDVRDNLLQQRSMEKEPHMALISSFDNDILIMRISRHFDITLASEFRQAYREIHPKEIIIDLFCTTNLSWAGLGMLLLLRDHVGKSVPIRLIHQPF